MTNPAYQASCTAQMAYKPICDKCGYAMDECGNTGPCQEVVEAVFRAGIKEAVSHHSENMAYLSSIVNAVAVFSQERPLETGISRLRHMADLLRFSYGEIGYSYYLTLRKLAEALDAHGVAHVKISEIPSGKSGEVSPRLPAGETGEVMSDGK